MKKIHPRKRWTVIIGILIAILLLIYIQPYHWGEDAYTNDISEVRVSGIDILLYYHSLWQNLFVGFPLVVQICYTIVLISSLGILILAIVITVDMCIRILHRKKENAIFRKFYQPLKEVCGNFNCMSKEEITTYIHYPEGKKWSKEEMLIWIGLFIRLRAKVTYNAPISNFHNWEALTQQRKMRNGLSGINLPILLAHSSTPGYTHLLTDGYPAFASDYHTGWYISREKEWGIKLQAGLLPSPIATLQISFLNAPLWNILVPKEIQVRADGKLLLTVPVKATLSEEPFQRVTQSVTIPDANGRTIELLFVRPNSDGAQTACDEILLKP